jgi:hypothetical protein
VVCCLTGDFKAGPKSIIEEKIKGQGGKCVSSMSAKVDVLIVGELGSEAWAFGNYGTKVQKALELQQAGSSTIIVREDVAWAVLSEGSDHEPDMSYEVNDDWDSMAPTAKNRPFMEKILVKYTKLSGKETMTEVIPGCIQRVPMFITRGITKDVLLMDDGTLKTDVPELASWKDIVSIHSTGDVIIGLTCSGDIKVHGPRVGPKKFKEEWVEIFESYSAWKNMKQLIIHVGSRTEAPIMAGLNIDGNLVFSGGVTADMEVSRKWSDIERLLNVRTDGVLAQNKHRTLFGSGRFSVLTGKRLAQGTQINDSYWYLENNEIALDSYPVSCVIENVSKIIKTSIFDYTYLTHDGYVHSVRYGSGEVSGGQADTIKNAIDILSFGERGKYLAVLYKNGEVRIFLKTQDEDKILEPLNDNEDLEVSCNYALYSGDVICENAMSIRFEDGKLIAKVNDVIAPEETTQSFPAINAVSIQEVQKKAAEANISQWIPYEHSDEYQKYYDRIFSLIEPEIERDENVSSDYPNKPLNIVRVYTSHLSSYFDIFALTKEGRVLYYKIYEERNQSEAERKELQLRKLSEWRDIVNLAIRGNYVSGLRKDGTVVTNSGYDCSKWNDIIQIVMGDCFLAGLRKDGTVIMSSNTRNNSVLSIKKWKSISCIAAGEGLELYGLTAEGKIVSSHSGEPSQNLIEISKLSDISSIAVSNYVLFALTKNRDLITVPSCEYAPVDLSKTVRIYNIYGFVFAQQSNGRVEILNKEIYYEDDWADACALEKIDDVVFSIRPDGSLKANWYQDKDSRFRDGSITLAKRLELIDKLQKTKGIARLHFQDRRVMCGKYRGVLAKLKNGSIVTLDDVLNGNIPSINNAGNVFVIKDQSTIATLNECSLTFKMRMQEIGKTSFEYEHFTLENVQSAHLYDKERSLFVKFYDNRYLSVGRVFFSSTSTREPLAYSSIYYRIERGSTQSRKINHVYGISGIAKDNRPFILSDELKFPLLHVLLLENENNILDCAKANVVENERFCFLRDDGTVLTLDTDLFEIQDGMRRKTSIRYWNNVRKLATNGNWIWGLARDNRFVMAKPSQTNQDILDAAEFEYWVPVEGEAGDKGETIYQSETASVVLYFDGSLRLSGERKLLPFYPLPIMKGIKRLLINDRYFFVLADDGTLWCSKKRFDPDERYLPDGTLEQKKRFSKWGQVRKDIVDIANRGDTVYLKVRREEFEIINQGEGERATPITDPEMLDFLSSQEYESIAGNKSIQKKPSVTENKPSIEELQDNADIQENTEEDKNGTGEAAFDEAIKKTTEQNDVAFIAAPADESVERENAETDKNGTGEAAFCEVIKNTTEQNDIEAAAPPAEESTEIAADDPANTTKTTANTYGPFQYKPCYIDGMGVEITNYTGTEGQVVIPAEIEGQPVLAINLSHNSSIESIELPEGMRTIGYSAFFTCPNLCSITIPSTINKIDDHAFWNCKKLEAITLPEKISFVGDAAFFGCSSLQSINIAGRSDYYSTKDGVLFRRKDRCLLAYPAGKSEDIYHIPQGAERIDEMAFAKNIHLKTVIMPDSVSSIGENAFWACKGLVDISLSKALTSISKECFRFCESLRAVELPEGITSIENSAFLNCKSLSSIAFPSGLESIQTQAFQSCENLTSIALPNSLKVLEGDAFYMCSKLVSITLPPNLETVYKKSFPRNKHLSMVVPKNSPMEAWVKEKGYQYTTTSQISDSYYSTERIAGSYEETLRRAKELMADAQATIAKLQADNALKEKKSTRIVELDKEILELSEELKALTGWFKGRQRRELQERIDVKKAELERLQG